MTETPQKPAMAIIDDQAMIVPPPVQIDPIWPMAARVAGSMPPLARAPDKAPVSGKPEKPDPSKPVMIPMINTLKAANMVLCGRMSWDACTRSNKKVGAVCSPNDKIEPAKSELPKKKNPAIGITGPIALKAKTNPSVIC